MDSRQAAASHSCGPFRVEMPPVGKQLEVLYKYLHPLFSVKRKSASAKYEDIFRDFERIDRVANSAETCPSEWKFLQHLWSTCMIPFSIVSSAEIIASMSL
jgi:hypothetical protein